MEPIAIGTTSIVATRGDISAEDVDAVVNAANNHLQLGAGVAGAIDRRGGPAIQRECDAWIEKHGLLPDDGAAVTTAGDMPARFVIHVAGPRTIDPSHLAAAVTAALAATQSSECRSVAIPAISAGTFGYPPDQAVAVIVEAATTWVTGHPDALDEVRFVGYDDEVRARFAGAIERFA
ncbi:macro domain-containing protein [bacterium]|nr:macro domain-containing protein [bacterium]